MPSLSELTTLLHHNQIFEVTIEKTDYDIKNLIVMQKARGLLALLTWTCGQSNRLYLFRNNTITYIIKFVRFSFDDSWSA